MVCVNSVIFFYILLYFGYFLCGATTGHFLNFIRFRGLRLGFKNIHHHFLVGLFFRHLWGNKQRLLYTTIITPQMFEIVQTAPVVRHKSRHEYLAPCPSPRNTTPMICRCNAPQLCDIDCRRGPTYLTGQYLHTGQRKYTRRTRMIPTRTARAGTAPSSISSHCPEACRSVDSGACVQATDGPRRIDTSFHGKCQ